MTKHTNSRPAALTLHTRPQRLAAASTAALLVTLAACGGSDGTAQDDDPAPAETTARQDDTDNDAAESPDAASATDTGDAATDTDDTPDTEASIDPVFHHVSAEAAAGSWGPLCNPASNGNWAPGWRITVPEDWTFAGSGGGVSSYDISLNTSSGSVVTVDWADSVTFLGLVDGTPATEIDFDGEMVTIADHSTDVQTQLSMDFTAQSAGGFVEMQGTPAIHQISVSAPLDSGLDQDQLIAILTSMRRERCAIFDALALDNALAFAPLLPVFDGGDPLGKAFPTTDRLEYDPVAGIFNPAGIYTDDQLAYILGYDQATSECFVTAVRPTLPATAEDFAAFTDPITPITDDEVAATEAVLAGC